VVTGARGRRGKTSLGCLLSLLVFVGALYYGVNIGEVWLRYFRYLDEMKTQARLAAAIDNGTIRRRLEASAEAIGLPDSVSRRLVIRRTESPREIRIETRYSELVDLPLFKHTFVFTPRATQPL
jgi:hypothetical protein